MVAVGENLWRSRNDTGKRRAGVLLGKSGQRQLVSLSVGIANEADSLLFHGGKVQIILDRITDIQQTTDNRQQAQAGLH